MKIPSLAPILGLIFLASLAHGRQIDVFTDLSIPQVNLVISELDSVCEQGVNLHGYDALSGQTSPVALVLGISDDKAFLQNMQQRGVRGIDAIEPEGFSIRKRVQGGKTVLWLVAADPAGLLYGGYEIAEQVRCYGVNNISEDDQNPYMAMRGVKFNIPLDVRSPSYTDPSDAAQKNIAEMWSFDFWKQYIESLARHRYNYVSCWSLHPFPSLVKVPGYEEIALDDVQRSTVRWKEHYTLQAKDLDTPDILGNVEVLKKMTIDEKIAFWKKVMAYGKLHNIDFYFVTWNIFTNGIEGKYGITDDFDNPVTRDYFRKSVAEMFLTYPDLKGIGLTTGENMEDVTFEEKEDWAFDTYAKGVLDVLKQQPDREITFIHRQHMAGALEIADKFQELIEHPRIEFIYSFKYAKAHVYSSTEQPYHDGFVKDIQSRGKLKTIWTLRNDDVYHFRWGSPDFVREFIKNIPYDVSRGYYYGSDQYIWGREFLSRDPESPRQIEIDKHWYQWMLWGRLGYDPELSNDRTISILQERFSQVDASKLFTAWQEASLIYPETTGFHWGALDFQWYIEACQGRPFYAQTPNGFHDVNRFISLGTHKGTDNISIPNFVQAHVSGKKLSGTTPFQVAQGIHEHSDKALSLLEDFHYNGNKELRLTLDDIRTIAWLGKYYAHKIEAATQLALFRETLDTSMRDACFDNLNKAASYWRSYASLALSNNENPLWTNRVGYVDWKKTFLGTIYDIRSTGGELDIPGMQPSAGGTILEAENATFVNQDVASGNPGFTGTGYVVMNRNNKHPDITWSYDAPTAGRYILELRYTNSWQHPLECSVYINGKDSGSLDLWRTGSDDFWVWDRVLVDMEKGENQIRVQGGGRFFIDHLNVIPTGE